MRIDEALDHHVPQLRANGRSPHTVGHYERYGRLLATCLASQGHSGEIEDVHHTTLARFLASPQALRRHDGRPKIPTSVNALRSSLKVLFGYMHRAGYLEADPSRLIRRAQYSPPPGRALTKG